MRYAFCTCVQLGLSCMEEIYGAGGRLDLVITLPDHTAPAKSGRVYLDSFCSARSIPVLKSPSINDACVAAALREWEIDWLFVIGWSQIANPGLMTAVHRGVLGMHPTLLPMGRGRAAVPWSILLGLRETGVTLFRLDNGVDTGPIADQERLAIREEETATTLYARVAEAHRTLIRRNWLKLDSGALEFRPQDESHATVWPGRRPEDGEIRRAMPCASAARLVRATTRPYPGAFYRDGASIIRVWSAHPVYFPPPSGDSIRLRDGWLVLDEWVREEISTPRVVSVDLHSHPMGTGGKSR